MKIGFIGAGNMGGAIVKAILKVKDASDILVCDYIPDKARTLGATPSDSEEIARVCDYIVMAVKPQGMREAFAPIQPILQKRAVKPVIVTPAAGLTIDTIDAFAGGNFPIIRIMPNMPVSVGFGMILYSYNKKVSEEQLGAFLAFMREAGTLDHLDEDKIDAASAISGCGPAFVYLFADALADGGVECGLPKQKALAYALHTLRGAAELAIQSGESPAVLKDAVCSPGGTTIRGIHALEEGGMRGTVMNAVCEAYRRNAELAKK